MFKTILSSILLLVFLYNPLHAEVTGKVVNYKSGGTSLIGYIAYDNSIKGKRPGVIVVPDWWGHSDFARNRARALAKLGYTAMVMDMVGGGMYAETVPKAKELMNAVTSNPKTTKARFIATKKLLSRHKTVNGKIAAIGYSLGGLVVLEMARTGVDVDGVVSIWGVIGKANKPARKGNVKTNILVLQAATDGWAPKEAVAALKTEMANAGANFKIITYPNTKHGFTRPDADIRAAKDNLPLKYDAAADKKSWNDLSRFLQISFR
jgi:dienelactone hydrolase